MDLFPDTANDKFNLVRLRRYKKKLVEYNESFSKGQGKFQQNLPWRLWIVFCQEFGQAFTLFKFQTKNKNYPMCWQYCQYIGPIQCHIYSYIGPIFIIYLVCILYGRDRIVPVTYQLSLFRLIHGLISNPSRLSDT